MARLSDPEKYKAIIEAATRLFFTKGFLNTGMDAVAVKAGVSKATIYSYFANKDILFEEIVSHYCARHSPAKDMLPAKHLPIESGLYKLGIQFLDMTLNQEAMAVYRVILAEAARKPALARMFYKTGMKKMNEILAEYLGMQTRLGRLHIGNIQQAAECFNALVKGEYYLEMLLNIRPCPTKRELDTHVREAVKFFLRAHEKAGMPAV
jgi:TetR/AcrR family transcriptional regulator, mexJK operon transcriptional repressor